MLKKLLKNFFKEKKGAFSIVMAILAPFIGGMLAIFFDVVNMLSNAAKLNDALREASLGANTFKDNVQKREYITSYLRAYFNDEKLDVSDIEISKTNIDINNSGINKIILNSFVYDALIKIPFWFVNNSTVHELAALRSESIVHASFTNSISADYVFAIDMSYSMSINELDLSPNTSACKIGTQEYNTHVCSKISNAYNKIEQAQAAISHAINLTNQNKKDTSQFAFLPFYAGSHIQKLLVYKKPLRYPLKGYETQKVIASYYILQMIFKPQYRVRDYECWSTVVGKPYALVFGNKLHFGENVRCGGGAEMARAQNFFYNFTSPRSGLHDHIRNNLYKVVDYEASLKNMFNPNRVFKFRFFEVFTDLTVGNIVPNQHLNGVAYDYYCDIKCIFPVDHLSNNSLKSLSMDLYEEDFKSIKDPSLVPFLNNRNRIFSKAPNSDENYAFTESKSLLPNFLLNLFSPFLLNAKEGCRVMECLGPGYYSRNKDPVNPQDFKAAPTIISSAILRGAAMLTKGKQDKKVLVIFTDISDGGDTEETGKPYRNIEKVEKEFFRNGRICERFHRGFRDKGNSSHIYFIVMGNNNESRIKTLSRFKNCSGENNVFLVRNTKELLDAMRNVTSDGKLGEFLNKNIIS